MSDININGLNPRADFSREIETEKPQTPKAAKKARLSRDAFVAGAKTIARNAKEIGIMMVPEGYQKMARGEKVGKYELAEAAGITVLYAGVIIGTGGAAGAALYAGGASLVGGSALVKHRKGIAKAARKLAGKINPKNLEKKVKDGSLKAGLNKLKHPKALLGAAGAGALALAGAGISAAASSSSMAGYAASSSSSRAIDPCSTSGGWIAGAVSGSSSSSSSSFAGQGDPVLLAVSIAVTVAGGLAFAYWAHREDQKADQKIGSPLRGSN